jgi:hypothetical protein
MNRSGKTSWPLWRLLVALVVFRYLCHALALLLILSHELRPGAPLPDLLLEHVPYLAGVARWNYVLWLLCYIPPALWIGWKDRDLFVQLVVTDGALSLLRALMIPLTGIGPVLGADVNALHPFQVWPAFLAILNPLTAIGGNSAGVYLTKDLFFSGHIATTFLLYLFSRRLGKVARVFLGLNLATLAVVLLAHLHYSIDIIAAYSVTYGVYRVSGRAWPAVAAWWGRIWGTAALPEEDLPAPE